MVNPHQVIDPTAEENDLHTIDPIIIDALQIPAWDDQTRVRLPPPGYTITQCPDLVRLAPDGTPCKGKGVVVGWIILYKLTNLLEWEFNEIDVAAYVNADRGVEFRLRGEDGKIGTHFFFWVDGELEPQANPITMKTVLGENKLDWIHWHGFWHVVKEHESLQGVKRLARSYVQTKHGGRWADPA